MVYAGVVVMQTIRTARARAPGVALGRRGPRGAADGQHALGLAQRRGRTGALVAERAPGAGGAAEDEDQAEVGALADRVRGVRAGLVEPDAVEQVHQHERGDADGDRGRRPRHRDGARRQRQHDERQRERGDGDEQDAPDRQRLPGRVAAEPVEEHGEEQPARAHGRQQLSAAQAPQVHQPACPRSRCIRAACSVLRSRKAIVIGPTPPGTGVIAPAISLTSSKSTSPTRPGGAWSSGSCRRR